MRATSNLPMTFDIHVNISQSYCCAVANHTTPPSSAKSHTQPSLELLWRLYLSTQTHTHPHIHIDAHPHQHTEIENALIFIQAIVVPFSHASQTTVKTHWNRLRLHRTMSQCKFHRDERCRWQSWSVETAALWLFQFPQLHKLVTGDNFNSYFSRGNCWSRSYWVPDTSKVDLSVLSAKSPKCLFFSSCAYAMISYRCMSKKMV